MDIKKATGYDNIPTKLLKPAASILSHHIAAIYNQCITTNNFPDGAKFAEVVPLYRRCFTCKKVQAS